MHSKNRSDFLVFVCVIKVCELIRATWKRERERIDQLSDTNIHLQQKLIRTEMNGVSAKDMRKPVLTGNKIMVKL